jgi:hypothetical protein
MREAARTADKAAGEGWSALIFPSGVVLAVSPAGDILPRALSELFRPVDMSQWVTEWMFEDDAGWDVYHVEPLAKHPFGNNFITQVA